MRTKKDPCLVTTFMPKDYKLLVAELNVRALVVVVDLPAQMNAQTWRLGPLLPRHKRAGGRGNACVLLFCFLPCAHSGLCLCSLCRAVNNEHPGNLGGDVDAVRDARRPKRIVYVRFCVLQAPLSAPECGCMCIQGVAWHRQGLLGQTHCCCG
jgi:hypothetical protein